MSNEIIPPYNDLSTGMMAIQHYQQQERRRMLISGYAFSMRNMVNDFCVMSQDVNKDEIDLKIQLLKVECELSVIKTILAADLK